MFQGIAWLRYDWRPTRALCRQPGRDEGSGIRGHLPRCVIQPKSRKPPLIAQADGRVDHSARGAFTRHHRPQLTVEVSVTVNTAEIMIADRTYRVRVGDLA